MAKKTAESTETKEPRAPYSWEALWPFRIWPPIVVITGAYGSGKSTLALGTGAPMERTLYLDYEKSAESFAAQLPLAYHDMNARIVGQGREYTALNVYTETVGLLETVQTGQYDVLVLDNASDLEDGVATYVDRNLGKFGLSASQAESAGGLRWGAIKKHYQHLLTSWASKFRMVVIIVQLRDKWAGRKPVIGPDGLPVREPKGKETLEQLCSVFLWMQPGKNGIPAANVIKTRLDRKFFVADPDNPDPAIPAYALERLQGEAGLVTVPVLPLRLPAATWPAIRQYMRVPADLSKPAKDEVPSNQELTDDQRLRIRAITAQAEADTAQAQRDTAALTAAKQAEQALATAKARLQKEAIAAGLKTDKGGLDVPALEGLLKPAGLWPFADPAQLDKALDLLRTAGANKPAA